MTTVCGYRRWFLWVGILVVGVLSVVLVLRRSATVPVPANVTWKPQPDQFPLGAAIQGSHVEFSAAFFTGQKATRLPASFARLPNWLRRPVVNLFIRAQAASAKSRWKIRVEAPPFVRVDDSKVDFDSVQGVMVAIRAHLDTDQPGNWEGNLHVSLRNRSGTTNAIDLPVRVNVLRHPVEKVRKVLVTETPYGMYSTDDGTRFLPLAQVTEHLAERGVQVDFREELPEVLTGYDLILLAGSPLVRTPAAKIQQFRERIALGAHVVLAADAFFVGTSQTATELMKSYGLQMENDDAGSAVTNVVVATDPLTDCVRRVNFWRPARITVTDAAQGKVLVQDQAGLGGFVAVSRAPGRGELRVVAQSLWWNWLKEDPAQVDNVQLMENLLQP